jgi:hypothetical protein
VKGADLSEFFRALFLNLLSTASLFLGHTPVASNALNMRFGVNEEVQAAQNNRMKSAFLTGSRPIDFWVKEMSLVE